MQSRNSRLADHETPFIRNEWYVAALSGELGHELIDRTILNISVLMYRQDNGAPTAMRNRCPHRSYPPSRGVREGDEVTCGYHGLRFGPNGKCVSIPSQSGVPSEISTPAYPVVERAPFVWIWMGEPTLADPATIPDHSWLSDPHFAAFSGYLSCRTNYVRLHENVLDLTHFPYVHGDAIGGVDFVQVTPKIQVIDGQVLIFRELKDRPIPDAFGAVIGNVGNLCHRTSENWFKTPGFNISHAKFEDLEGGVEGKSDFNFNILHCFTPETKHSTHYFFGNARDASVENAEITETFRNVARKAFLEDEEVLHFVEKSWVLEDNSDYGELSVRGDLAGLHMRRLIAERAALEAGSPPARTGALTP